MRLEKVHEAELERRKGSARKTVIQVIWLLISFVIAYFVSTLVIFSPDNGLLTHDQIYRTLQLSRSSIKEWMITGAIMIIIVFFMQMFLFIGFALASCEGRRRPGTPSLYSRHKDPQDSRFD